MKTLLCLLLLSLPARAQLLRDARRAPAADTPTAELADMVKRQLGREPAPDEDALALYVAKILPRGADRQLAQMAARGQEFDEDVWPRYQARKQAVEAAVAGKRPLEVITPAERDDNGYLAARENTLQPADAEVAALEAMFTVAAQKKDFATLIDLCALMSARRFFAPLERFMHSSKTRERDAAVWYQKVQQLGLRTVQLGAAPAAKPGEWVQFRMLEATLGEHQASAKKHYQGMSDYDCRDTGKIAAYDRSNGQLRYQQRCKQKMVVEDLSIDVALRQPVPDWARSGRDLPVVGRVVKAGPHWRIADAFVCDRSLGGHAPLPAF